MTGCARHRRCPYPASPSPGPFGSLPAPYNPTARLPRSCARPNMRSPNHEKVLALRPTIARATLPLSTSHRLVPPLLLQLALVAWGIAPLGETVLVEISLDYATTI